MRLSNKNLLLYTFPSETCRLNLFMPSGLSYLNSLDRSISYVHFLYRVSCKCLLLLCFVEISELNANSVGLDQTPHSAASDLVFTACQCPIYGALGVNGLRRRLPVMAKIKRGLITVPPQSMFAYTIVCYLEIHWQSL